MVYLTSLNDCSGDIKKKKSSENDPLPQKSSENDPLPQKSSENDQSSGHFQSFGGGGGGHLQSFFFQSLDPNSEKKFPIDPIIKKFWP